MNRRTLIALIAGGASASVLAACGVAPQAPAPAATTAAAKPAAAAATQPAAVSPKSGGILKQAMALEVVSLDPMLKVQNDFAWIGVYDRLIQYDDKLKPQPMLAESWDVSSDAKQVKINLRKGVQF